MRFVDASRRLRRRAPFNGSSARWGVYPCGECGRGCWFPPQEVVDGLWASCYGADVEWSLRGGCELYYAGRGEWGALVVLSLRSLAACIGNKVEEVLGRGPVLQTSYHILCILHYKAYLVANS